MESRPCLAAACSLPPCPPPPISATGVRASSTPASNPPCAGAVRTLVEVGICLAAGISLRAARRDAASTSGVWRSVRKALYAIHIVPMLWMLGAILARILLPPLIVGSADFLLGGPEAMKVNINEAGHLSMTTPFILMLVITEMVAHLSVVGDSRHHPT